MSPFEAAVLGILQGLSEFLPISSSGHLKLGEALFGFEDLKKYLLFDIVCHVGTLLAILCAYAAQLRRLDKTYARDLIIATLPLLPCTLFLGPIKQIIGTPQLLGYFFLGTAVILIVGERLAHRADPAVIGAKRSKHALLVGCAQTLALFPGVSRSGTTISALRMMGWEEDQTKQFAFLMAIPAILGSVVVEGADLLLEKATTASVSMTAYSIGFVCSFISGYAVLLAFFSIIRLSSFRYFAIYCTGIGLLSLWLLG